MNLTGLAAIVASTAIPAAATLALVVLKNGRAIHVCLSLGLLSNDSRLIREIMHISDFRVDGVDVHRIARNHALAVHGTGDIIESVPRLLPRGQYLVNESCCLVVRLRRITSQV